MHRWTDWTALALLFLLALTTTYLNVANTLLGYRIAAIESRRRDLTRWMENRRSDLRTLLNSRRSWEAGLALGIRERDWLAPPPRRGVVAEATAAAPREAELALGERR